MISESHNISISFIKIATKSNKRLNPQKVNRNYVSLFSNKGSIGDECLIVFRLKRSKLSQIFYVTSSEVDNDPLETKEAAQISAKRNHALRIFPT